ncbi:MAG: prepilin-type N-terminal cleavage/methylation domain-containing protein [Aquificaceae bacterium]|nr:prepilin-type N-terminal cleavage/methylation domain-containing protein [Aquificaceae bacterium]
MFGNRGFTLIEVLVATLIIGIGFTVLFEILAMARAEFLASREQFRDLVELNNKLQLGNLENLTVDKKTLKDYPQVQEETYRLRSAEIFRFAPKQ